MKHTPGPWVVREPCPIERAEDLAEGVPPNEQELTEVYAEDEGDQVCYVMNTTACEAANARLIAAAPEMLAALKMFVEFVQGCEDGEQFLNKTSIACRCCDDLPVDMKCVCCAAQFAIAKAEGRE